MTKHRYFYVEADHLADRGYNKALQVYRLTKGFPEFIGGDYRQDSASWKGYPTCARLLISNKCGHKLPDEYRDFPAKSVTLRDINGYR